MKIINPKILRIIKTKISASLKFSKFVILLSNLFFFNNCLFANELDLESLSNDLNFANQELQEELSSLADTKLNEAIIFDSALDNLQESIKYIEQSISNKNIDAALLALKFLDNNLSNISSIIPSETFNDMSNINLESFSEENLLTIKKISDQMNENQNSDFKEMINEMILLEEKGLNVFEIFQDLDDLGVNVDQIDVKFKSIDEMNEWSTEDWANAWNGEFASKKLIPMPSNEDEYQYIDLSNNEIIELKAQLALNYASQIGIDISTETITSFDNHLIRFTGIDHNAAIQALQSLDRTDEEWADSWTGEEPTTYSLNGKIIEMTDEEKFKTKVEWAKNTTIKSIINNELDDNITEINLSELRDIASTFNVVKFSDKKTLFENNASAVYQAIEELNKSDEEWADSWTGEEPQFYSLNGVRTEMTDEEKFKTKVEWAKNQLASSIISGDQNLNSLNLDKSELLQINENAAQNLVKELTEAEYIELDHGYMPRLENIENMDVSSLKNDLQDSAKNLLNSNERLSELVQERNLTNLDEIEERIGISVETLVSDTSNWTDQQWADSWTGEEPTTHTVNGVSIELTDEEKFKTKVEWAKNQKGAYSD